MKEIIVSKNDAGQRLDKLLGKYLNQASTGFIYKMLRKKNIKLNGKKASGNEIVQLSDQVEIFLSDETFEKFSTVRFKATESQNPKGNVDPYAKIPPISKNWIIYEDSDVCLINKPQGYLSQKAAASDISINEMFVSYLLKSGQITQIELQTFHPAICNRLDRNTSGILIAGKSLKGLQTMAKLLQGRDVHKYYWCIVKGNVKEKQRISGYLSKDAKTNKVEIQKKRSVDAKPIVTEYTPLYHEEKATLLEVLLVTGRTHQIRAHLSSIGHPIFGDLKYGDMRINDQIWKSHKIKDQMLHARRLEFPADLPQLPQLSGRVFEAPLPAVFETYVNEVITCQPGNPED